MSIFTNGYKDKINSVIDSEFKNLISLSKKELVFLLTGGMKKVLSEDTQENKVVTVDKSSAPVFYVEYLSGTIEKIDTTDDSNITILTAQSGGVWANRKTTNVYTKGGV